MVALRKLAMPAAEGVHAWTPFFYTITKESEVLLMAQAFLTYDEQLDKLQTEKELSIPDLILRKTSC